MPKPKHLNSRPHPGPAQTAAPAPAAPAPDRERLSGSLTMPDAFKYIVRGLKLPLPAGPRALDRNSRILGSRILACWLPFYRFKHKVIIVYFLTLHICL